MREDIKRELIKYFKKDLFLEEGKIILIVFRYVVNNKIRVKYTISLETPHRFKDTICSTSEYSINHINMPDYHLFTSFIKKIFGESTYHMSKDKSLFLDKEEQTLYLPIPLTEVISNYVFR